MKQVIFFGFTDNTKQETTLCTDLGNAHELFDEAMRTGKYEYIDISIDDGNNSRAVRSWTMKGNKFK
ncbi:MAG TPA: hypothetical protein VIM51_10905 [Desulfosporosinus sp.]